MARPNKRDEKRNELLPVVAEAFSELGYHRATTAELAKRCKVQENILYRLWRGKKRQMFIAAIDHLRDERLRAWRAMAAKVPPERLAEEMLGRETERVGEQRLHRLIFAALAETDDAQIRRTVQKMYLDYQQVLANAIADSRRGRDTSMPAADHSAWAAIGLVTMINIITELELLGRAERKRLFTVLGGYLLDGQPRHNR